MKLVYVAGPYTNPDPIENTHNACREADAIYQLSGHSLVPIVPHMTLIWHMVIPHADIDFWYNYDLAVMSRCDVVLRLAGASTGADGEVREAERLGIPVAYSTADLLANYAPLDR